MESFVRILACPNLATSPSAVAAITISTIAGSPPFPSDISLNTGGVEFHCFYKFVSRSSPWVKVS